jgi:hypothetical protein
MKRGHSPRRIKRLTPATAGLRERERTGLDLRWFRDVQELLLAICAEELAAAESRRT